MSTVATETVTVPRDALVALVGVVRAFVEIVDDLSGSTPTRFGEWVDELLEPLAPAVGYQKGEDEPGHDRYIAELRAGASVLRSLGARASKSADYLDVYPDA